MVLRQGASAPPQRFVFKTRRRKRPKKMTGHVAAANGSLIFFPGKANEQFWDAFDDRSIWHLASRFLLVVVRVVD